MPYYLRWLAVTLLFVGSAEAAWYTVPNYADSPAGDDARGQVPAVREAAVAALGDLNGSVVVLNPDTGRLLAVVNEKLAMSDGYMPCSTIKLAVGLAGLSEGLVERGEDVWFTGGWRMNMAHALGISNNVYFDKLGQQLGWDTWYRYMRLYGFSDKAGLGIAGEQVAEVLPEPHKAGLGRMSTFGDGIHVNPLQMAAFTGAVANGGKLYWLQLPRTRAEQTRFLPKLKRRLPIIRWVPELYLGMREAVLTGTAKKLEAPGQRIWGKTGTCSQYEPGRRTRLGWFTSFRRSQSGNLVVVVMLRGGALLTGGLAAEVAGRVYSNVDGTERITDAGRPEELLAGTR